MKYLVAVSGGIDSVVLLDMLAKSGGNDLVVAHFDHGIRPDSADDARFVEGLAWHYGLEYVTKREELGKDASEERARSRRYAFLRKEAARLDATIVTAHHQDDVIESIAINLLRGTGWKGLAVFAANDIARPLLRFTKKDIRTYALANKLEWVEDSTNLEGTYLRNRLRRRIGADLSDEQRERIIELWRDQAVLRNKIEAEMSGMMDAEVWSRYFMTMIDPSVAMELLRAGVSQKTGVSLTRPQAERALLAIKTARPGSTFEAGSGVKLQFTATTFIA